MSFFSCDKIKTKHLLALIMVLGIMLRWHNLGKNFLLVNEAKEVLRIGADKELIKYYTVVHYDINH